MSSILSFFPNGVIAIVDSYLTMSDIDIGTDIEGRYDSPIELINAGRSIWNRLAVCYGVQVSGSDSVGQIMDKVGEARNRALIDILRPFEVPLKGYNQRENLLMIKEFIKKNSDKLDGCYKLGFQKASEIKTYEFSLRILLKANVRIYLALIDLINENQVTQQTAAHLLLKFIDIEGVLFEGIFRGEFLESQIDAIVTMFFKAGFNFDFSLAEKRYELLHKEDDASQAKILKDLIVENIVSPDRKMLVKAVRSNYFSTAKVLLKADVKSDREICDLALKSSQAMYLLILDHLSPEDREYIYNQNASKTCVVL